MTKPLRHLSFLLLASTLSHAEFFAEGSDLMMGVGSADIARGGASTAKTSDIYAIFHNPAGLAEIKSAQLAISTQADATLRHPNFFGLAYAFHLADLNLKVALAFAYIPRLMFSATGTYKEKDFESIFLRYPLPDLSKNFSGNLNSSTDEYRFAAAVSPIYNRYWSLGLSVGSVNCATTFAGVALEDPQNFTYKSTVAHAISFNVGTKYFVNDELTMALSVKNINSTLITEIETIDKNGRAYKHYDVEFPLDIALGAHYKPNESYEFMGDYQQIFGNYGTYSINFKMLRTGMSLHEGSFTYHGGLIVPIELSSTGIDSLELPFPVAPTAGLGWHHGDFDLSAAFYIHPFMSLHLGRPSPSLDLSVIYSF